MIGRRPVLVVDDDPKIVRLVRTYLEREALAVIEANDGRAALAAVALEQPSLIILDVMLPEVDGLSVLAAVRRSSRTPVIMLSARGTVDDRITGLELGADDYLPKPFSPAELVVRVKRLLERAGGSGGADAAAPLLHGDLALDMERHEVSVAGRAVDLTRAEFRLLAALLQAGGRVLSRDQLMDALYGLEGDVLDRTIDVHVGRLRSKLGDDPSSPRYIATVRGVGYRVPQVPERVRS
ncbi:MAG TPA: response regulator transcription factor [Candidatus Caenarcaniphilales bacterium]|nr:response regulator transcription factor [Candidatus Caenarcaniphilales bacterium]